MDIFGGLFNTVGGLFKGGSGGTGGPAARDISPGVSGGDTTIVARGASFSGNGGAGGTAGNVTLIVVGAALVLAAIRIAK